MPRPGPRPYECVRRAWHSDRHPPIRGSLIQEIFRIVNEVHSSGTRKNREWQEKLPVVVLKAEEIMYSKANSEAEYSDLKTLWYRVNDAIDTIIRRDDTEESGVLLQPCIEAALHLGCTPKRSSRSQRNESPRCYLRPKTTEATSVPPSNVNINICENTTGNNPSLPHSSQLLTHYNKDSCLRAGNQSIQNINRNEENFHGFPKSFASYDGQLASMQACTSSNTWSVYPLCYDNQIQPTDCTLSSTKPSNSYLNLMESDKLGGLKQNLSTCQPDTNDFIIPSNHKHPPDERQVINCDLTLRLGPVEVPCASTEDPWHLEMDNRNPRTTFDGSKFKSFPNK